MLPASKAKMLRGLVDRSRLAILEALRSGEKTVSALADDVTLAARRLGPPGVSWGCRLVATYQVGR